MTFAIDANLLLYASDRRSPFHERALEVIDSVAAGSEIVYVFWPVAMAYLRIATHPAIFEHPLTRGEAVDNLGALLTLPHVQSPGEQERFWGRFLEASGDPAIVGNLVPDAHLVTLMLENGVRTIWTRDRDFRRFQTIQVLDPFG